MIRHSVLFCALYAVLFIQQGAAVLTLGDEVNASTFARSCEEEHGPLYNVGSGNVGIVFQQSEEGEVAESGIKVGQSIIGTLMGMCTHYTRQSRRQQP